MLNNTVNSDSKFINTRKLGSVVWIVSIEFVQINAIESNNHIEITQIEIMWISVLFQYSISIVTSREQI